MAEMTEARKAVIAGLAATVGPITAGAVNEALAHIERLEGEKADAQESLRLADVRYADLGAQLAARDAHIERLEGENERFKQERADGLYGVERVTRLIDTYTAQLAARDKEIERLNEVAMAHECHSFGVCEKHATPDHANPVECLHCVVAARDAKVARLVGEHTTLINALADRTAALATLRSEIDRVLHIADYDDHGRIGELEDMQRWRQRDRVALATLRGKVKEKAVEFYGYADDAKLAANAARKQNRDDEWRGLCVEQKAYTHAADTLNALGLPDTETA